MRVPESGLHLKDVMAHYGFTAEHDATQQRIGLVDARGDILMEELQRFCALEGLPAPRVSRPVPLAAQAANDTAILTTTLQLLCAAAPGAEIVLCQSDGTQLEKLAAFEAAVFADGDPLTAICFPMNVRESEMDPGIASAFEDYCQDAQVRGTAVVAPAFAVDPLPEALWPACSPSVLACAPAVPDEFDPAPCPALPASQLFGAAPWQRTRGRRASRGRRLPDVCAIAGNDAPYRILLGRWGTVRSPSVAALIWTGVIARLVQARGARLSLPAQLYSALGPAGALQPVGSHRSKPAWQPGSGWGAPDAERMLAAAGR